MVEEEKVEVPILQQEFAEHLAKYRVKKEMVNTIAENIAEVGGATIFENPELLNHKLVSWSQYIGATLRKQILDHWFAKKGIPVSEEMAKKFALTSTEVKKETGKEERKKKVAEGEVWVVKVDDKGIPRISMTGEGEPGISLEEAKKAVREIRKEYGGEEALVIYDEKTGKHMPNFKAEFVKANPTIGWVAAKQMDKAMAEGGEVDPLDIFVEQMAKMEQMKQFLAPAKEPEAKGTIGEIIQGVKDLQSMAKEGKGELPSWLSDPASFIQTIEALVGEGKRGAPSWVSDPAALIKLVREIGGEPKTDDAIKTELSELRKALQTMQEEKHEQAMANLRAGIQAQGKAHEQQMKEILDRMEEIRRPATGRTEMDIIHEVASGALEEAKGFRTDIKSLLTSQASPLPKTSEQREGRKQRYREALETDKKVEEIGRRLFFREG